MAQNPVTACYTRITCLVGNPKLNLYLPLSSWGATHKIYSKDDGSYIPCWTHFLKKYMILVGQFLFDFITTIYSSVFFSCALKKHGKVMDYQKTPKRIPRVKSVSFYGNPCCQRTWDQSLLQSFQDHVSQAARLPRHLCGQRPRWPCRPKPSV